jgi:hypothetical protein
MLSQMANKRLKSGIHSQIFNSVHGGSGICLGSPLLLNPDTTSFYLDYKVAENEV